MVTAIVLANVERGIINETAQELLTISGVSEVYSVAGEWDLAIMVRVREAEQLADLVAGRMLKLKGIARTTTLIAFRAYSNYDLDRMFSIGFNE
jgi:DNA-binding Lrp family transcriptional regulator